MARDRCNKHLCSTRKAPQLTVKYMKKCFEHLLLKLLSRCLVVTGGCIRAVNFLGLHDVIRGSVKFQCAPVQVEAWLQKRRVVRNDDLLELFQGPLTFFLLASAAEAFLGVDTPCQMIPNLEEESCV